jgi:hypothetical protein
MGATALNQPRRKILYSLAQRASPPFGSLKQKNKARRTTWMRAIDPNAVAGEQPMSQVQKLMTGAGAGICFAAMNAIRRAGFAVAHPDRR